VGRFEIVEIDTEGLLPLAEHVSALATDLWTHLVTDTGGHHGVAGPPGQAAGWSMAQGELEGAIATLQAILPRAALLNNAVRVLHELFEAGDLEDHFYHIKKSEGQGYEGPRMLRWGKACHEAKQLLKGYAP